MKSSRKRKYQEREEITNQGMATNYPNAITNPQSNIDRPLVNPTEIKPKPMVVKHDPAVIIIVTELEKVEQQPHSIDDILSPVKVYPVKVWMATNTDAEGNIISKMCGYSQEDLLRQIMEHLENIRRVGDIKVHHIMCNKENRRKTMAYPGVVVAEGYLHGTQMGAINPFARQRNNHNPFETTNFVADRDVNNLHSSAFVNRSKGYMLPNDTIWQFSSYHEQMKVLFEKLAKERNVSATVLESAVVNQYNRTLIRKLPSLEDTTANKWVAGITDEHGNIFQCVAGDSESDEEKQLLINEQLAALNRTCKVAVKRVQAVLVEEEVP